MSDQDQVLTDEEKGALLDGMESGEVEVQSSDGTQYADVQDFVIGPRSRIVSNSYPRLQTFNQKLASRFGRKLEQLLNAESDVVHVGLRTCTYTEFCERSNGLTLLVEFKPVPLEGSALVQMDAQMVGHLVETFFGGGGNDSRHEAESGFTTGETNVAGLFCNALLGTMADVWEPVAAVAPEQAGMHLGTDVIESIDANEPVIVCAFTATIEAREESFNVLLPLATIASLLPVFEGQKRDRDPAEDARWGRAIRTRITDSNIRISSRVGRTRMTLGAVAELKPGAVIDIANPQRGTVFASDVPVLEGRFGVHDGRYAIEAGHWLEPDVTGDGNTA
jgi:flagellar motor switch protein FliM